MSAVTEAREALRTTLDDYHAAQDRLSTVMADAEEDESIYGSNRELDARDHLENTASCVAECARVLLVALDAAPEPGTCVCDAIAPCPVHAA